MLNIKYHPCSIQFLPSCCCKHSASSPVGTKSSQCSDHVPHSVSLMLVLVMHSAGSSASTRRGPYILTTAHRLTLRFRSTCQFFPLKPWKLIIQQLCFHSCSPESLDWTVPKSVCESHISRQWNWMQIVSKKHNWATVVTLFTAGSASTCTHPDHLLTSS